MGEGGGYAVRAAAPARVARTYDPGRRRRLRAVKPNGTAAYGVATHPQPRLQALPALPLLPLLVAVLLALGSCSGGGGAGATGAGSEAVAAAGAAELPQRPELPLVGDFQIVAYQGGEELGGDGIALSAVLAQGKPVVLNFWAGLCPPCRAEMPEFQEVYDEFKDRIILVGIDLGPFTGLGTRAEGKALLTELDVTYPAGTTDDVTVVARFGVLGMPSTLFVTPGGGLSNKWTGLLTRRKLTELIEELLAVSAATADG